MNIELAEKVLAHIKAHPEAHNQENWLDSECGTTACIAGHTMLASGEYVRQQDDEGKWRLVHKATGWIHSPSSTAERLLDIDPDVGQELFFTMDKRTVIHKLQSLINKARERQHPTKENT